MKPVIGITPSPIVETTSSGTFERYAISSYYVSAVAAAGGVPLVLPPQDGDVETLLGLIDGLLFSGGADIDPNYYGETELHPATYDVHPLRDRFELELIRVAIERDYPSLCICRGIQLLNVACGGSLYQHVPDQYDAAIPHRQQEAGYQTHEPSHSITVEPGSLLATAYGAITIRANSYHHQAVKKIAPSLRATGWTEDGLIEAVELHEKSFVLGVQWHPEMMFQAHPEHLAPFKALAEAATVRRLAGARA
jgi:putative glutamine amidotransferase